MSRRFGFIGAILVFSLTAWGQDPQPPSGGWRRFNTAPAQQPPFEQSPGQAPGQAAGQYPGQAAGQAGAPAYAPALPPPVLVLNPGSMITVRVDQVLSSDHNVSGDIFTASLLQPVVVNGFIVAGPGQTIAGRVADAEKGGRVQGTSRLGLELTELSLVDGQQVPIRTQLMQYHAGTSNGRDAAAIATSTGVGAAIGAAADGGFGAGMGAIAGAGAAAIGVLVTRGYPTVVHPESVLTFRTLDPVTISTERSAQAFEPVRQGDYQTQVANRPPPPPMQRPAPGYYGGVYGPGPVYGGPGWYGPGWYGPGYYGGTGIYIRTGPRYYGRGRRY